MEHRGGKKPTDLTKPEREQFLTRKSSGGHQAKRRKEEKTQARGTGRRATASALSS
jgi:hypothetical protein